MDFFSILTFHKPSLGSREFPQKNWARSAQLFWIYSLGTDRAQIFCGNSRDPREFLSISEFFSTQYTNFLYRPIYSTPSPFIVLYLVQHLHISSSTNYTNIVCRPVHSIPSPYIVYVYSSPSPYIVQYIVQHLHTSSST